MEPIEISEARTKVWSGNPRMGSMPLTSTSKQSGRKHLIILVFAMWKKDGEIQVFCTVFHQWWNIRRSQSIFSERQWRNWRGKVGKKCLNGNETKANIRHKKMEGFLKEKFFKFTSQPHAIWDSQVPTYEGNIVGVLLGGSPKCLPTLQEVFWIQLVYCSKWDFKHYC